MEYTRQYLKNPGKRIPEFLNKTIMKQKITRVNFMPHGFLGRNNSCNPSRLTSSSQLGER